MRKTLFLFLTIAVFLGCDNNPSKADIDSTDSSLIDDDLVDEEDVVDDVSENIDDSESDLDRNDDDLNTPCSPNPCEIENSTGECIESDGTYECICEENYLWNGEKCDLIPAKVYVDINAKGLSNGTSWEDAYPNLQRAINESDSDSEIWVAKGIYKPSGFPNESIDIPEETDPTYPRYRHFTLKNGIALYGGFEGNEAAREQRDIKKNETVLSGDMDDDGQYSDSDLFHVIVNVNLDSSAILDGFIITGGNADLEKSTDIDHHEQHGGGMYNHYSSSPEIYNCHFTRNYALISGGGMENRQSGPYIDNCTFENNVSFRGGGMNNTSSSPRLYRTEFKNNTTVEGYGGGVFNDTKSRGFFNECTFSGNTSEDGAAISNVLSDIRVQNCVFENNTAQRNGGAITNSESSPVIWFSTFKGNKAVSGGGAIENYSDSEPKIVGCTFYDNEVTGFGEGGAILSTSGRPVVVSSVFYDNSAPSGGAISNRDTEIYLINSTFVHNTADPVSGYGGAIYSQTNSLAHIINSIFWDNSASGTGDEIYNEIAETEVSNSNISGSFSGGIWDVELGDNKGGNTDTNPSFRDTANNDFSLKSNSSCIDKGDNSEYETGGIVYSFQEDITESTRIVNDIVDMGAWEFQK